MTPEQYSDQLPDNSQQQKKDEFKPRPNVVKFTELVDKLVDIGPGGLPKIRFQPISSPGTADKQ